MMKFTKAVATGNDFIVVEGKSLGADGRGPGAAQYLSKLAKRWCDRKRAIGADGLLVLEDSERCDFKMRIFNSDGSEAEMCGNGSRCIALYAAVKKITGPAMTIETLAGDLDASVDGQIVKVRLTEPKEIKLDFCLMIGKCPYKVNFVNTGVPHAIHFVEDLDKVDVKNIGSHIRNHGEFSPEGTNADFVKITGGGSIAIRTYERGVEDETLACGTGAVASAIIAAEREKMGSPVVVKTHSGEEIKVYFEMKDGKFENVYLEGKAQLVYEGAAYDI
jgi:diaminopimelate epimerase